MVRRPCGLTSALQLAGSALRGYLLLPLLASAFMLWTCPVLLLKALRQIAVDLVKYNFKASEIQRANQPHRDHKSYENVAHYSAQCAFQSTFADRSKFEACFRELLSDAGIDWCDGLVDWRDEEVPRTHFDESCPLMAGDHYVGAKGSNFKIDGRRYKKYTVALAMFEKAASADDARETTVMQAHLPSQAWDGTSCFNFVKELVARYHDAKPNRDVFRGDELISMSPAGKKSFDNKLSIFHFIASVPVHIFNNASAIQWMRAKHALGYSGSSTGSRRFCMLNLSAEASVKLAKALKDRPEGEVKPTAALIYSAVMAYQRETGDLPYCVSIQASLQTRAFEPHPGVAPDEPLVKERAFVGDWLVAPLHHVRSAGKKSYSLVDAQQAYATLLKDLASCGGAVKVAFYARVFGVVKGGAASFEKVPTYADSNRLCDGIFFNNYGFRTIHENSRCVSWNWSGAGKLGCNCILINGRICICFASEILPFEGLERIRDTAHETLSAFAKQVTV